MPKSCKIYASAGAGFDWVDTKTMGEKGRLYKYTYVAHLHHFFPPLHLFLKPTHHTSSFPSPQPPKPTRPRNHLLQLGRLVYRIRRRPRPSPPPLHLPRPPLVIPRRALRLPLRLPHSQPNHRVRDPQPQQQHPRHRRARPHRGAAGLESRHRLLWWSRGLIFAENFL